MNPKKVITKKQIFCLKNGEVPKKSVLLTYFEKKISDLIYGSEPLKF
jgi:hypothetical protein